MIAYLLVIVLCPMGAPDCFVREFEPSYATLESCAEQGPASSVIALRDYVTAWREVVGTDPPPTQVTVGCKEERST